MHTRSWILLRNLEDDELFVATTWNRCYSRDNCLLRNLIRLGGACYVGPYFAPRSILGVLNQRHVEFPRDVRCSSTCRNFMRLGVGSNSNPVILEQERLPLARDSSPAIAILRNSSRIQLRSILASASLQGSLHIDRTPPYRLAYPQPASKGRGSNSHTGRVLRSHGFRNGRGAWRRKITVVETESCSDCR